MKHVYNYRGKSKYSLIIYGRFFYFLLSIFVLLECPDKVVNQHLYKSLLWSVDTRKGSDMFDETVSIFLFLCEFSMILSTIQTSFIVGNITINFFHLFSTCYPNFQDLQKERFGGKCASNVGNMLYFLQ